MFWLENLPYLFLFTFLFPSTVGFTSLKPDTVATQPTTTGPGACVRPAISSFSSSGMGLSENLKTRLSWQCDPYLHVNKVTDNKSITCHSTRLPPSDSAKQNGMGAPSKSGRSTLCASETDFQDKLKPAVGTCDCDTWLVQNQWEATKCVACETPKPGPGVKRVLTLPVASESAVTATASSYGCTVTTGALRFRRNSKRPVGSWQCPLCCDYNKAEDKKCVTCMYEKPGTFIAVWKDFAHYFRKTFYFILCPPTKNNVNILNVLGWAFPHTS